MVGTLTFEELDFNLYDILFNFCYEILEDIFLSWEFF